VPLPTKKRDEYFRELVFTIAALSAFCASAVLFLAAATMS